MSVLNLLISKVYVKMQATGTVYAVFLHQSDARAFTVE
jgi:hypothetical protein